MTKFGKTTWTWAFFFIFVFISGNTMAASMEVKKTNFGLRFENQVEQNEFIITNVQPTLSCSTSFTNEYGLPETVNNSGTFKYTNYPTQLRARFGLSHYFQMIMNKEVMVESPKKTFYENKICEFGVSFDVAQLDTERTILRRGVISAHLYKSEREVVDVMAELNALPPLKFYIIKKWDESIEFQFSEGGIYSL